MPERMGAPTLRYHPSPAATAEGSFDRWVRHRNDFVEMILASLTDRWKPLASFLVVNFEHPEYGPAGAMIGFDPTVDVSNRIARLKRVSVIPMSDLSDYTASWRQGQTVLVRKDDMAPSLQARYIGSLMRWSLNVPIFAGSEWVGLVGAAADDSGLCKRAVSSFETAAQLLGKEFAADSAWEDFSTDMGLPHLAAVPPISASESSLEDE